MHFGSMLKFTRQFLKNYIHTPIHIMGHEHHLVEGEFHTNLTRI